MKRTRYSTEQRRPDPDADGDRRLYARGPCDRGGPPDPSASLATPSDTIPGLITPGHPSDVEAPFPPTHLDARVWRNDHQRPRQATGADPPPTRPRTGL